MHNCINRKKSRTNLFENFPSVYLQHQNSKYFLLPGYMYNGVYRTMIEDNESRKFLDTFLGPTITVSHAMRIVRNAYFSIATRFILLLYLPLTRYETMKFIQNASFKSLKAVMFSDGFLHNRIFRFGRK